MSIHLSVPLNQEFRRAYYDAVQCHVNSACKGFNVLVEEFSVSVDSITPTQVVDQFRKAPGNISIDTKINIHRNSDLVDVFTTKIALDNEFLSDPNKGAIFTAQKIIDYIHKKYYGKRSKFDLLSVLKRTKPNYVKKRTSEYRGLIDNLEI